MSKNWGDAREGRSGSEELLLRVAWFYYKDELTQEEIAKRLSVSRASVGRMLDHARKVGLVSINLNADHLDAFEVSRQLRRTFGLSEALVVPDHASGEGARPGLNARLGRGGAQFMSTHLRAGGTLGVGWGDTVSRVIASTSFGAVGPVRMVSLTGGVDAYLPAFLSSKGDGASEGELASATVIPTPIVTSTPELAAALKAEPSIEQVLKQACGVEQAIVGVGTPTADATIVQIGYLEADDVRALRDQHVVGDILGQFFDAAGRVVPLPIHGQMAPGFEHSLTIQASVISRQSDRVIVDAGNKSVAAPADVTMAGHDLEPVRFDEEHGVFAAPDGSALRVGDSVALVPGYSPTTVNWYDAYHVVRDDTVVDIWPVLPRGPGHHGLAT